MRARLEVATVALAMLLGTPLGAAADEPDEPVSAPPARSPFDRGRISFGLALGSQSSYEQHYIVAGGGVGYYLLHGLEVGLQGVHWFGGDPGVSLVSPSLRYVFWQVPWSFKPYLGSFYDHWFVGDPFDDVDTVGGRVGLIGGLQGGLVIGAGVAAERVVSTCDEDCVFFYPELTFAVAF